MCSKDNQNSTTEQNGENNETMNDTDASMAEVKTEDKSADDINIPSDLDNQITDLLSTIRKAEENDENGTDAEMKNDGQQDENNATDAVTKKEPEQDENEILAEDENDDNEAQDEQTSDEVQAENNDGQGSDDTPKQDTETKNGSVEKTDETKATQPEDSAQGNGENSEGTKTANSESNEPVKKMDVDDDKLGELKGAATGRSTPTRTSARLANVTPSSIRTRRASRLAQN